MLCNITQNSMRQIPRGYPARSSWGGGYPARSGWGGTLLGGTKVGYPWPGQDGGYPARGDPARVPPWQGTSGQVRMGGVPK